jgi:RHS repeat-associated protein
MGLPASVSTGNITRSYAYDSYGSLTGRSATSAADGTFQNYSYGFNASTGNLTFRKDNGRNKQENFTYDGVNRLSSFGDYSMDYYEPGLIESKSDAGGLYSYCLPNNFYGLSEIYDATNEAIPAREQYATYTSFERSSGISENGYEALFTYDGNGDRKRMQMKHNGTTEYRRYYLGERYEAELGASADRQFLYIGGDAYSAPAVPVNQGGSWNLYYICRDHLGSMTHLANENGAVAYEYSYDAWGRLRDPATLATYAPDNEPALFLNRGYTGHEHLPRFGLINMNARMYDPAPGLFLSPDPYIQAPDFSQNYNTYAYCLNNPLKYTDKDGEWIHLVIGAVIGGTINLIMNADKVDNFWQGLGYFGVGAAAGALGAGVGTGISSAMAGGSFGAGFIGSSAAMTATSSFVTCAAIGGGAGFSGGFVTDAGNSWLQGNSFGTGLWNGTKGGLIGGASGALLGGLWSGLDAVRDGRDFWGGKPWKTTIDYSLLSVKN